MIYDGDYIYAVRSLDVAKLADDVHNNKLTQHDPEAGDRAADILRQFRRRDKDVGTYREIATAQATLPLVISVEP